jgi:hypothetical protein
LVRCLRLHFGVSLAVRLIESLDTLFDGESVTPRWGGQSLLLVLSVQESAVPLSAPIAKLVTTLKRHAEPTERTLDHLQSYLKGDGKNHLQLWPLCKMRVIEHNRERELGHSS